MQAESLMLYKVHDQKNVFMCSQFNIPYILHLEPEHPQYVWNLIHETNVSGMFMFL